MGFFCNKNCIDRHITAVLLTAVLLGMFLLCSGIRVKAAGGYVIPEFRDARFNADAAEGNDSVQIDLSSAGSGYVALNCSSSSKIKFQVLQGDLTFTYSVVTGIDQLFPLQCGSGHYTFKVVENIEDKLCGPGNNVITRLCLIRWMQSWKNCGHYRSITDIEMMIGRG